MARDEAKIRFTAETEDFNAQIDSAKSRLSTLRSELKLNEAEFRNTGDSANYLAKKHDILEEALSQNKKEQEALSEKIEKAKAIYGENSDQVEKLTRQLNGVKTEEQNFKGQLAEVDTALQSNEEQLEDVGEAAEDAGKKAESSGSGGWTAFKQVVADLATKVLTEAIDKIKEFAKETLNTGMSFESSIANVNALQTAAGASAEDLQLLEDAARNAGATTQFSATEAADALGYMALAGWDANTSVDALPGILNLAAASGMDLAKASDTVTDYLSAFGMEANQSAYFADLMTYAQANANTSAEQLGEAYRNSAANLSAAGQDVETVTSLLAMMANQGLKGSEAGTALAAVMRDITNKMEDGAIQIGETTVQVQDAQGNFRDLTDILADVEAATDGMGDAEKAAALSQTFTANSTKGLNLILAAGVDQAADFEESLRGSGGTAEDVAAIMTDTLGGDLKKMDSAMDDLKLSIYDEFQEPLREVVQTITEEVIPAVKDVVSNVIDVVTNVKNFVQEHPGVLVALGAIAAAVAVITTAITAYNIVQGVKAAMDAAQVATLPALIAAEWAHAAAAAAAVAPYVLVVAAIAAVIAIIVLCVTHWEQIKETVLNVAKAVKEKVVNAWNNVKEKTREIFTNVVNAVKEKWENIKTTVSNKINAAKTAVSTAVTNIKTKVTDTFANAVQATKDKWEDIKSTVTDKINTAKENVATKLTNMYNTIDEKYGGILTKTREKWEEAKTAVANKVTDTYNKVKTTFTNIATNTTEKWNSIKTTVSNKISDVKQKVADKVTETYNAMKDGFQDALKDAKEKWEDIKTNVSDKINEAKEAVSEKVESIKSKAAETFASISSTATEKWQSIKSAITDRITEASENSSGVLETISRTVGSVFGDVLSTVTEKWEAIKSAIENPINTAKEIVSGGIEAIKGFFNFSISWPHIPMPHFSISPPGWSVGDLLKGSIPSLGISWYAGGAVFDKPTIIPTVMGYKGVGEAGPEAVSPVSVLQEYIRDAVDASQGMAIDYDLMATKTAEACARMSVKINLDNRELGRVVRSVMA